MIQVGADDSMIPQAARLICPRFQDLVGPPGAHQI
jgi:hypothetical protein